MKRAIAGLLLIEFVGCGEVCLTPIPSLSRWKSWGTRWDRRWVKWVGLIGQSNAGLFFFTRAAVTFQIFALSTSADFCAVCLYSADE